MAVPFGTGLVIRFARDRSWRSGIAESWSLPAYLERNAIVQMAVVCDNDGYRVDYTRANTVTTPVRFGEDREAAEAAFDEGVVEHLLEEQRVD